MKHEMEYWEAERSIPRRIGRHPLSIVFFLFAAVLIVEPARGESLMRMRTRKDDMNAVNIARRTWTLQDLIDFRALAPNRFDSAFPRLGRALALGIDGLQARRALAPARFDFFHPMFAFLLDDVTPGDVAGEGPIVGPDEPETPTDPGNQMPDVPVEGGNPPDGGGVVTPPDGGGPFTPPDDGGGPFTPPDDGGGPFTPPDDGGGPFTPPDDGGGNQNPGPPPDGGQTIVIPEPAAIVQVTIGLLGVVGACGWSLVRSNRRRAAD